MRSGEKGRLWRQVMEMSPLSEETGQEIPPHMACPLSNPRISHGLSSARPTGLRHGKLRRDRWLKSGHEARVTAPPVNSLPVDLHQRFE
jgi:hypothetical protein